MAGPELAPLLSLHGVWKSFRAGVPGCCATVRVLRGVSFSVHPGEVVAITGHAGAGKSTLLLCAAAIVRPDRGRVSWQGRSAGRFDASRAALVPASPVFRASLTVSDVFALYALSASPCTKRHASARLLRRLDLWALREERVAELGSSLLRRLALACVLAAEPAVLLVDAGDGENAASDHLLLSAAAAQTRCGSAVVLAGRERTGVTAFATRHERLERGILHPSSGCGGADRRPSEQSTREVARGGSANVRVAEPGGW